ncbi:16S rRNA (guanine(527)-N(7))-methyltransferase RsmG [Alkalitalea saponilacus]|uniref:Ribosomal RNA small subunit methyltransferase G n=1 Tax=Alkalitalea saponilacus TaxID=889453 RepID=A0A1T5HGH9_9BACT|nr:16S rRNA (guanine(527)-N(7))-methyltransferase RsmG [Alkalitalea saponilacus]ASB48108.1 16S rRNA (guanine(527)-N(7))-methyltransferase RsmG [Alkalitalea saponilacus]SKC19611.1 16S rRNA (guanine527-N7)-methyltransferase [Alkalitalea saponilacus]
MTNPLYQYFSILTDAQKEKFDQLKSLYDDWNSKINVISRKDMDAFYEHHVLHSLAIAKFISFSPRSQIVDIGTGGGFPGIPLSIMFPDCKFVLVDSIGKKIKVVNEVIKSIGLINAVGLQSRSEQHSGKYDFIVSRAVTTLPDFVKLTKHLISPNQKNAISNGILYLKGGEILSEVKPFGKRASVINLNQYFQEPFFETKKLVHLSL